MNLKFILFFNFSLLVFFSLLSENNMENIKNEVTNEMSQEIIKHIKEQLNTQCADLKKIEISSIKHENDISALEKKIQNLEQYNTLKTTEISTIQNLKDQTQQEFIAQLKDKKSELYKQLLNIYNKNYTFYNNRAYYFMTFCICIATVTLYNIIFSIKNNENYKKTKKQK
jgi:hypothetical protein